MTRKRYLDERWLPGRGAHIGPLQMVIRAGERWVWVDPCGWTPDERPACPMT